jgi:hypothetical protein
MAATSALVLSPTADTRAGSEPTRSTGCHQAPGTALRTRHPGRHRATGRGRLAHPVIVVRPLIETARSAGPTSGGRPAPLAKPHSAPTAEPVLTLAGGGRHRALDRAVSRPTADAAGRYRPGADRPAVRHAVRFAAVLAASAVLLPLSAGQADAAPKPAAPATAPITALAPVAAARTAGARTAGARTAGARTAGARPAGAQTDLPDAPGPEPRPTSSAPVGTGWPTVGIAMALLLGITISGSAGLLLLRPAGREPARAR